MAQPEYWEDYDVLTIETPEMLELRLPLAGFGPRALAFLVDNLLSGVATLILSVIGMIVLFASGGATSEESIGEVIMAVLIAATMSTLVYWTLFEYFWNGQTPGKRWLGIRVVRRGGLPLGFGQAFLRNLLRLIDYLPSGWLAGIVCFFCTRYQQRIGDLAADTAVIREFRGQQPQHWAATPDALSVRPASPGTMNAALRYAASSYLARSRQLDQSTRLQLTDELIRRLGYSAATLSLAEREEYLVSVLYQQSGGQ